MNCTGCKLIELCYKAYPNLTEPPCAEKLRKEMREVVEIIVESENGVITVDFGKLKRELIHIAEGGK